MELRESMLMTGKKSRHRLSSFAIGALLAVSGCGTNHTEAARPIPVKSRPSQRRPTPVHRARIPRSLRSALACADWIDVKASAPSCPGIHAEDDLRRLARLAGYRLPGDIKQHDNRPRPHAQALLSLEARCTPIEARYNVYKPNPITDRPRTLATGVRIVGSVSLRRTRQGSAVTRPFKFELSPPAHVRKPPAQNKLQRRAFQRSGLAVATRLLLDAAGPDPLVSGLYRDSRFTGGRSRAGNIMERRRATAIPAMASLGGRWAVDALVEQFSGYNFFDSDAALERLTKRRFSIQRQWRQWANSALSSIPCTPGTSLRGGRCVLDRATRTCARHRPTLRSSLGTWEGGWLDRPGGRLHVYSLTFALPHSRAANRATKQPTWQLTIDTFEKRIGPHPISHLLLERNWRRKSMCSVSGILRDNDPLTLSEDLSSDVAPPFPRQRCSSRLRPRRVFWSGRLRMSVETNARTIELQPRDPVIGVEPQLLWDDLRP